MKKSPKQKQHRDAGRDHFGDWLAQNEKRLAGLPLKEQKRQATLAMQGVCYDLVASTTESLREVEAAAGDAYEGMVPWINALGELGAAATLAKMNEEDGL